MPGRYNKARGYPTLYICGTDEYGTATETKALEEGVTPRELCDKYAKIHKEIYDWFEIEFDYFGRSSTQQQEEIVQHVFKELHRNGFTIERVSKQPYCEKHKAFLADRYIEGTCPKCGYEDARGDQCDKCGSVDYEPLDLINPRCKIDPDVRPIPKETKHIHLRLDELQPEIEAFLNKSFEAKQWSKNAKIIAGSWLKQGLRDRAITRDLKWGVPVPLDVFEKQEDKDVYKDKVFYVWFDACIGYVSITANYTEEWEKWWRDPENVKLYHFMGKDNVPFHSVIFPGCLIGTRESWTKVNAISATEYLNYENGKFSKSRGVGVFGNNAKDTGIPADVWRYYLLKARPETGDSQFEWKYFIDQNNSELLNKLGNFVNRVIKLVNSKIYNSVVPDYSKSLEEGSFTADIQEVNSLLKQYNEEMESIGLRAGINTAMAIAQAGNNFLQSQGFDNRLAANEPERAAGVTGVAINLILLCASVFHPFLPATSRSILEQLNTPFLLIPDKWTANIIQPGHKINKAKYLFTQINPAKEQEWRDMYGGTQAERLKKEEEAAKKAAKKAADKAKKAAKKATAKPEEERSAEQQGSHPKPAPNELVDSVVDGVQQVTLPSS